jgi:hypothetical protein
MKRGAAPGPCRGLVTLLIDFGSIQKWTEATGSEAHFWLGDLVSYE